MRHRLGRIATCSFASAAVLFATVAVRAVGNGTNPDPDAHALAASFTPPDWATTLALVTLPLLALLGSLVFTPTRRRRP